MKQAAIGFLVVASVAACDRFNGRQTPVSATPARPLVAPRPAPTFPVANWRGAATVVSRSGSGGCGAAIHVGERLSDVGWLVTIDGQSISLDKDISNWPTDDVPFSGTLHGLEFTAHYYQGDNYAGSVCSFREATLVGRFSPDFATFEALETAIWGVPAAQTVVQRQWVASRM